MHFYFGWGDRELNVIHNRLRNVCSSLIADLHLVNLKPSPACICGHDFEDCIHFFFECPFCNENRAILFNKLENYMVTIELMLAGDENLTPNQNIEIFSAVYSFIRSTQHSSQCCFCLFETLLLYSTVLNVLFHLILLYTYFIIIV